MSRCYLRYWTRWQLSLPLMSLLLSSIATGCNNQASSPPPAPQVETVASPSDRSKVVTTFLPMYWFTKAVAGEEAQVEILVPPGTEVHEYQATPANVQAIATADVLVKNGLGLEEFLEDTIKNAGNSKLKQVEASQGIKPVTEISPVEEATSEEEHEHEHSEGNPHVWLDPVLAQQQVNNIRDGLIAADLQNKATYTTNAANYIQQLQTLDREFRQRLQKYPNCTFVTFHDAYPYLAQRYKLKQVAVVEIPEDQLSPQDIQRAIAAVKKYNVKAVFGEPGTDNRLLKNLSQDLNLTFRPIDPLETGETNPQYYFTAMKANLKSLESACQ
ncbi:MAG: High-affinity zinc uptake system binding-protein ZnuA [Chroococcidiopsis sp. SAG 2025]|uniref:metal ABC transporter solute-binding protein, Zn/Mn family n=1 Tax=Chroococcidiopsis sp. SAG 2025 TaxID=171389 RepID=UPI002937321C|nr:zinc ABC transporter substrate-binding protein [Chroococcidiopsis sp. SAG 2025]MDV2990791.1 High-affinity zinc uptake system binding-protein ZnuA [Chroococcidiopsis sp. SAG 2025]